MKISRLSTLLYGALLMCVMTQLALTKEAPGLYDQIEGDWITYRGDQYEIMHISQGMIRNRFYSWDGKLRFERISDLKLKSSGGAVSQTAIEKGVTWI